MIITKNIIIAFGVTYLGARASAACTSVSSITCAPMNEPTLDGKTEDWSGVQVFEEPLTGALTSKERGTVKIRCGHDADSIYFLFEVPGKYRFAEDNNHMCASISTMFQMGEDAQLYNMGNCPLASNCNDNSSAIPGGCNSYKVDLGGHWELRTTGIVKQYHSLAPMYNTFLVHCILMSLL